MDINDRSIPKSIIQQVLEIQNQTKSNSQLKHSMSNKMEDLYEYDHQVAPKSQIEKPSQDQHQNLSQLIQESTKLTDDQKAQTQAFQSDIKKKPLDPNEFINSYQPVFNENKNFTNPSTLSENIKEDTSFLKMPKIQKKDINKDSIFSNTELPIEGPVIKQHYNGNYQNFPMAQPVGGIYDRLNIDEQGKLHIQNSIKNPQKKRIISEQLIDDIVNRRKKLFSENSQNSLYGSPFDRNLPIREELIEDDQYNPNNQNEKQSEKPSLNKFNSKKQKLNQYRKNPRPDPGKYTYMQVKANDFKTSSLQQNILVQIYRKNIKEMLSQLERTPIDNQDHLRQQVQQLRDQLAEIQDKVDVFDPNMQSIVAQKYAKQNFQNLISHVSNKNLKAIQVKNSELLQQDSSTQASNNYQMSGGSAYELNSTAGNLQKKVITIGQRNDYVFKDAILDKLGNVVENSNRIQSNKLTRNILNIQQKEKNHQFSIVIGVDQNQKQYQLLSSKDANLQLVPANQPQLLKNLENQIIPFDQMSTMQLSQQQNDHQAMIDQLYKITDKQQKNLKQIFQFYSHQHETSKKNSSFEELHIKSNRLVLGDYLKFCKDFDVPISIHDQKEVFRKMSIRTNQMVDFEIFQDILREIFFIKYTEERVVIKQKEIKILGESNISWSMEQKQQAEKELQQLFKCERDKSMNQMFLHMAHEYFETSDKRKLFHKVKSVLMPFHQKVLAGEKFDEYNNHAVANWKKIRYVSTPRTGINLVQQYDDVVENYFGKKLQKQQNAMKEILDKSNQAAKAVQQNRKKYNQMKIKSVFQPVNLNRQKTSVQSPEKSQNTANDFEFQQQSMIQIDTQSKNKDSLENQQSEIQIKQKEENSKANWRSLKQLSYQFREEKEIGDLIGFDIDLQEKPIVIYDEQGDDKNPQLKKQTSFNRQDESLQQNNNKLRLSSQSLQSPPLELYMQGHDSAQQQMKNKSSLNKNQRTDDQNQMVLNQNELITQSTQNQLIENRNVKQKQVNIIQKNKNQIKKASRFSTVENMNSYDGSNQEYGVNISSNQINKNNNVKFQVNNDYIYKSNKKYFFKNKNSPNQIKTIDKNQQKSIMSSHNIKVLDQKQENQKKIQKSVQLPQIFEDQKQNFLDDKDFSPQGINDINKQKFDIGRQHFNANSTTVLPMQKVKQNLSQYERNQLPKAVNLNYSSQYQIPNKSPGKNNTGMQKLGGIGFNPSQYGLSNKFKEYDKKQIAARAASLQTLKQNQEADHSNKNQNLYDIRRNQQLFWQKTASQQLNMNNKNQNNHNYYDHQE